MTHRGDVLTPYGTRPYISPPTKEWSETDQQAALREAEQARFQAGLDRRKAEDAEREKKAAEFRAEEQRAAAETLDADLRQRFFEANPAGTEADFKRLLPQLRDAEMVRRAEESRNAEIEGLRRRFHAYSF